MPPRACLQNPQTGPATVNKYLFFIWMMGAAGLAGCASTQKSYNAGYDRGRSDTVKQQYWITQNQQKTFPTQPEPRVKHVPITTTYRNPDGTISVPTTELIRIEE